MVSRLKLKHEVSQDFLPRNISNVFVAHEVAVCVTVIFIDAAIHTVLVWLPAKYFEMWRHFAFFILHLRGVPENCTKI